MTKLITLLDALETARRLLQEGNGIYADAIIAIEKEMNKVLKTAQSLKIQKLRQQYRIPY